MDEQFAADVRKGLSSKQKYLLSKYFYNPAGDRLFQQIMELDEYYLTRAEYKIFEDQKSRLLEHFAPDGCRFDLIEFGAGDGYKTRVLIEYFLEQKADFTYIPIDISGNVLNELSARLKGIFPAMRINPIHDDYFHALEELNKVDTDRKIILFLGSNIGNFRNELAIPFLSHIAADMTDGDRLLIGFDLKKDPAVILKAYNDPGGITREFNLNLLCRINDELGGNFNLSNFRHNPIYDPVSGEAVSYLISTEEQDVWIEALGQAFHFEKWEPVHMEISRKYSLHDIQLLAESSGFRIEKNFFDPDRFFTDSLWALK